MDSLSIQDLRISTHIGVPDAEREKSQDLLISVWLSVDTKAAAQDDDVRKSINYFDVAEDIKALAQTERKTIERFAEEIADMTLKKYKPSSVTVNVKKLSALQDADSAVISITRPYMNNLTSNI